MKFTNSYDIVISFNLSSDHLDYTGIIKELKNLRVKEHVDKKKENYNKEKYLMIDDAIKFMNELNKNNENGLVQISQLPTVIAKSIDQISKREIINIKESEITNDLKNIYKKPKARIYISSAFISAIFIFILSLNDKLENFPLVKIFVSNSTGEITKIEWDKFIHDADSIRKGLSSVLADTLVEESVRKKIKKHYTLIDAKLIKGIYLNDLIKGNIPNSYTSYSNNYQSLIDTLTKYIPANKNIDVLLVQKQKIDVFPSELREKLDTYKDQLSTSVYIIWFILLLFLGVLYFVTKKNAELRSREIKSLLSENGIRDIYIELKERYLNEIITQASLFDIFNSLENHNFHYQYLTLFENDNQNLIELKSNVAEIIIFKLIEKGLLKLVKGDPFIKMYKLVELKNV